MSVETAAAPEVMNRNEQKAWKSLQKYGLELVEDIVKVEIRRPKGPPVVVDAPKVYKVPGPVPSYVVMGPLRLHNMQQELARTYKMFAQQQALAQARAQQQAAQQQAAEAAEGAESHEEAQDGDAEIDTTGLDEEDIKMAVEQTGRSKKVVVEALRAHDGDLVETIMALTG